MRKSVLNFALLAISILMATMFVCSTVVNAQNGLTFIYDKKESVETIFTLDKSGKYLSPELKYENERNVDGNIISKKAYRWNSRIQKWTPYYLITFLETHNVLTVEYARWDNKKQLFSQNIRKAIYNRDADNQLFALQVFNWNQTRKTWDLNNQLVSQKYLSTDIY